MHEENVPAAAVGIIPHTAKNSNFFSEMLYFFGEVEVVFGVWCIPLLLAISYVYDWKTALNYVNALNYNEALFIMVSLALTSTRPILQLAEKWLGKVASLGGNSPSAWWLTLLTVGPFLGAVFKESVAMTILAMLLSRYFYKFHPTPRLAYTTLALLFLYVSVAGMLTSFASSSVYVVKGAWKWTTPFMLQTFGWKVLLGIVTCNLIYFLVCHADLIKLDRNAAQTPVKQVPSLPIPIWITAVHVIVLIWIILNSENTIIALGSFVLFLGFYLATAPYQHFMELLEPLLVGFFLASLLILSGLQIWWIEPLLSNLGNYGSYVASLLISAFIHNTSANILYTHIPHLSDALKYFLFCGTMVGGALTIMSNGPNIIGYTILSKHFDYSISLKKLFFIALWPTIIMALIFALYSS